jgi:Domain of unknown function (DUF1929)
LPLCGLVTRRADVFGVQSIYFRTSVKGVLTGFAIQGVGLGKDAAMQRLMGFRHRRGFLGLSALWRAFLVGMLLMCPVGAHDEDPSDFETEGPEHAEMAVALPAPAPADLAVIGRWSGPYGSNGIVPIHSTPLRSGKVLYFGRDILQPRIINPVTRAIQAGVNLDPYMAAGEQPFCAANILLKDGKVLLLGGNRPGEGTTRIGTKTAIRISADGSSAFQYPDMNDDRYYSGATRLENGHIVVVGGWLSKQRGINRVSQVLNPSGSGTWRSLTGATNAAAYNHDDYYPFVFPTLKNGRVFFISSDNTSWFMDTQGSGALTKGPNPAPTGPAVFYAPGKILLVGGRGNNPQSVMATIDLNVSGATWKNASSMAKPRAFHSLVNLPDGTVFINGGTTGAKNEASLGVKIPEVWNPTTGSLTPLAEKPGYPQLYHHSSVLLSDGRVLTGGGGQPPYDVGLRAEFYIYEPPYLFQGTRPAINGVSDSSPGFGQSFTISTANPGSIDRVTVVALPSMTHGYNFGQGFADLPIVSKGASSLTVTAPTSTQVPPGQYYLFLLDGNVPSKAKVVRIG